MSEHYNVEKITRQLKRQLDANPLPPGAPHTAVIMHRNREMHVHFLRMVLTEKNLGSDPVEILAAVASVLANMASNLIMDLPEPIQSEAADAFCKDFRRGVRERLDGTGNHAPGARLEFEPEQGGHA